MLELQNKGSHQRDSATWMAAANAAKPIEMMYSSEPHKNEFFSTWQMQSMIREGAWWSSASEQDEPTRLSCRSHTAACFACD
jgi:hypothetical protein